MIMMLPRYLVSLSMPALASFDRKMRMPMAPAMTVPAVSGRPNKMLNPVAAPPTFPILNTRPPKDTKNAIKYPSPGSTLLAISWPRRPDTPMMDQMLNCVVTSRRIVQMIASAKVAP